MCNNYKYRNTIYDKYVSTRDQSTDHKKLKLQYSRKPLHTFLINKIKKNPKMTIIDLGAGDGELVEFIKMAGFDDVRGFDISSEQIEKSKLRKNVQIEHNNIWDALSNLKDNSVDVVFTIDLIEHLTKNELLDLSHEIYRVLTKGGSWILHAPNANSPHFGSIRYGDITHEQAFTCNSLTQIFRATSFISIKFFESGPFSNSLKGYLRIFLWRILRLFYVFTNMAETGESYHSQILTRNLISIVDK